MPRSGFPHCWVESKTAIAAEAFARRLREWPADGSESQTRSKSADHAKYAVLMCARPLGETVAIAHSVDASSSPAASVLSRAVPTGRFERRIAIGFSERARRCEAYRRPRCC